MGLFDTIASTFGNLTDNVLGMTNQNHQNKVLIAEYLKYLKVQKTIQDIMAMDF